MGDQSSSVTKLRVGGCKKDVLEWFNYTRQAPTPNANLAAKGYCIDVSPVLRQVQPDGGESCITLESRPTRSLVAELPRRSSLAIHNLF